MEDHPEEFSGWAIPNTGTDASITFGICYFQMLASAAQTDEGIPFNDPFFQVVYD